MSRLRENVSLLRTLRDWSLRVAILAAAAAACAIAISGPARADPVRHANGVYAVGAPAEERCGAIAREHSSQGATVVLSFPERPDHRRPINPG